MKIVIRMDDITPDMDWAKFYQFKEILDKYHLKPLIGVVPDNQDTLLEKDEVKKDFWQQVRDLQKDGWVIAMHGYQHKYTTKKGGQFPLNHFSEFAGLSFDEQLSMIQRGKEILIGEGIETDIFMAPAHSFDKNTIKALKQMGFSKLTDGFGPAPFIRAGILFMPISQIIGKTLRSTKEGISTWVFHTNTISEEGFKKIDKQMEQYLDKLDNYDTMFTYNASKQSLVARTIEFTTCNIKRIVVIMRAKIRR